MNKFRRHHKWDFNRTFIIVLGKRDRQLWDGAATGRSLWLLHARNILLSIISEMIIRLRSSCGFLNNSKTAFVNSICFRLHVREGRHSVGSLERANVNHWTMNVIQVQLQEHLPRGWVEGSLSGLTVLRPRFSLVGSCHLPGYVAV
jgi:hypothetical protein